jgi:hypothetical protein
MKSPEKKAPETPKQRPEPRTREERGQGEHEQVPQIDFANLDLRVETVEERISPSETNVFDK